MEPEVDPDQLFARLLGGRSVIEFLAADFALIQSGENREYLYGLLAKILAEDEANEWRELSRRCPHSLFEIARFASEVEPKTYRPDERLRQTSQVLRGAARVINFLQAGRPGDACDVAERIDWPAVRQVVAYGLLRFFHVRRVAGRDADRQRLAALLRPSADEKP